MNFSISDEQTVYSGFLKIIEAQVTHDSFQNDKTITTTRSCMERGDSVAILIYEIDTDCFLFTKQFRYPSARRDVPWMLELVAGSIEENENPISSAQREVKEEIGYEIIDLELITTYFPSPGGCSEQISLFYTSVTSHDKTAPGGGAINEKEDIKL